MGQGNVGGQRETDCMVVLSGGSVVKAGGIEWLIAGLRSAVKARPFVNVVPPGQRTNGQPVGPLDSSEPRARAFSPA